MTTRGRSAPPSTGATPGAPDSLTTARLVGERVSGADLPDFLSYYGDPRVIRRLDPGGSPWTPEAVAALLEGHVRHWVENGFGTWVFRDANTRAFVGRAGLRKVDLVDGPEVELFYGVPSDRWGEGYATEMAVEIVEVAFSGMGLPGLVAFTLPSNLASRRVLEKCGFVGAGEITHAGLLHLLFRCPRESRGPKPVG